MHHRHMSYNTVLTASRKAEFLRELDFIEANLDLYGAQGVPNYARFSKDWVLGGSLGVS